MAQPRYRKYNQILFHFEGYKHYYKGAVTNIPFRDRLGLKPRVFIQLFKQFIFSRQSQKLTICLVFLISSLDAVRWFVIVGMLSACCRHVVGMLSCVLEN